MYVTIKSSEGEKVRRGKENPHEAKVKTEQKALTSKAALCCKGNIGDMSKSNITRKPSTIYTYIYVYIYINTKLT